MKKILSNALLVLMFTHGAYAQTISATKIISPNQMFLSQLQAAAKKVNLKQYKAASPAQKDFIELFKKSGNASSWGKKEYKSFMLLAGRIINKMSLSSDPDDGGEVFQDPDDGGAVFVTTKKFIAAYNSLKETCTDVIFRCQWKFSN